MKTEREKKLQKAPWKGKQRQNYLIQLMIHLRFLKRSKACVTEISNREFQLKNQIVIIILLLSLQ
jgi:hypothetical protein